MHKTDVSLSQYEEISRIASVYLPLAYSEVLEREMQDEITAYLLKEHKDGNAPFLLVACVQNRVVTLCVAETDYPDTETFGHLLLDVKADINRI